MDRGRIVECAAPAELTERPRHLFTAGFLGARTVLAGHREAGLFHAEGITLTLPNHAPGQPSHVVLRAKRLALLPEGATPTEPLVAPARIEAATRLDDSIHYEVSLGRSRIRVHRPSGEPALVPGTQVTLTGAGAGVPALHGAGALRRAGRAGAKAGGSAAAGLGAGPAARFWRITLPLSLPGLRAGLIVTFLLASTAFVSATLIGGRKVWVSGMIGLKEGIKIRNYPLAAALAMLMLFASVAGTILIGRGIAMFTPWIADHVPRRRLALPPTARRVAMQVAEALAPVVSRVLLFLAIGILVFPLMLVAVASVNDSPQPTVAQFLGFTWKWDGMVLQNERYLADAWVSLQLALACVAVSLAISLPAAFAPVRAGFKGRESLAAALMLPLALPGIAIGLGMLRLLQWFTALPPSLGILAVHVVLVAPFMLALLRASVAGLDRALEEAASGLGAPPARMFRRIILPQLGPGIAVACVIGFLISFGEVTVTAFLTTARLQTLPVRIYAEATFSLENTVNAISTIFILMTVALLVLVNHVMPLDRVWKR